MTAPEVPAEIVEAAVRAVQDADARAARRGYSAGARPGIVAARVLTAAWPLIAAHVQRLPRPEDGCVCSWESEDRGGGYSELVAEYEPACPVHSEHLWDPRQGMWIDRAQHDAEVRAAALTEAASLRHGTDLTPTVMSLGAGPDIGWWYRYLEGLDETWRANLRARAAAQTPEATQ